jgi:DNA-directed RNA polymerase subunit RPC12/RpoP
MEDRKVSRKKKRVDVQEPEAIPMEVPGIYQEAVLSTPAGNPREFWPEGKPMPKKYKKRAPIPCPRCSRVLLPNLGQAVVAEGGITKDFAYLRCKACKHRWTLPVQIM